MKLKLILFVLKAIAITYAKIKVELTGNFDPSILEMKVTCSGNDTSLISDTEIRTFKLEADNLKSAALQEFNERPDQAYLSSPNFWGDMYQSHNWTQVTRNLKPDNCKVLKISSVPQIEGQQLFVNNSTVPVNYDVDVSHLAENDLTSIWSHDGKLTVDSAIGYEFSVGFLDSGGSVCMSYTNPWGVNNVRKLVTNIGRASSVEVVVPPKGEVTTLLHSLKATVSIEINYVASVAGDVIFYYDVEHKGHKFWELAVETVMSKIGLLNYVTSKEVIDMVFLIHSKVIVNNKADHTKITEVFV